MNTTTVWSDQVPDRDGVKNPINDVAFSPGLFRLKYYFFFLFLCLNLILFFFINIS